jgi:hypothetical protein
MMFRAFIAVTAFVAGLGTVPMAAQSAQSAPPPPVAPAQPGSVDRSELRHQIYVMEGALARAVEFGAQMLNREIRSIMPDMLMLAGQAQARGVYLDGYGIFFDVEVPILRQSMAWSIRAMIENDQAGLQTALDQMRRFVASVADPTERATIENALNRLELQARPMATPQPFQPTSGPNGLGQTVGGNTLAHEPPSPAADGSASGALRIPADKLWVKDPNRAYTEAVQNAIIGAMIDYSGPMRLGSGEWLTVGARDNEHRDSLAPQDPAEEVVTVLLQMKGSDLAEYRAGAITRDELRRRVMIREF